jgi:predicted RNA-binding Zn ribbon-like protein
MVRNIGAAASPVKRSTTVRSNAVEAAPLDPGDYGGTYKFVGGRPSLDLVNTVSWPDEPRRHDWLDRPANLVAWCRLAGIVDEGTDPAAVEAAADLAVAHEQRAVLRDVLKPVVHGEAPEATALARFDALLADAAPRRLVRPATPPATGFAWAWAPIAAPADLLAPVVVDAADLLVEADLGRLGACPACGWLYLDTTRNRGRRWCDMADCGSRAKSRDHYHRRRARGG